MHLEPGHPDAATPLLALAARVLEDLGGEVVIHTGDDNLVRSRRDGDPGRAPYIVEAAGLPNLLHELVHVLQFGRLADDHGLDYSQIPYDLGDPAQRRHLWGAKWYGEGVPVAQNRRAGRPSNGKAVVMLDFGFALKNGDCVGSGQHWRRENLSPNGTLGT